MKTTKIYSGHTVLADANGDAKIYRSQSSARRAGMRQTIPCFVLRGVWDQWNYYVAFYNPEEAAAASR